MIPKISKLPLRTELLSFRKHCKKIVTPRLTMCYGPCATISRLGVIVPKKLSKLATTRNWLKRLTYDTFWPLVKDKNLDCVIIYKPLLLKKSPATHHQIVNELTQALNHF